MAGRLFGGGLDGHEAHGGLRYSFANRLGISRVGLASPDVSLNVARRHHPDRMPELPNSIRPVVRACTRFDPDKARAYIAEEVQHLRSPQGSADDDTPVAGNAVNLKY